MSIIDFISLYKLDQAFNCLAIFFLIISVFVAFGFYIKIKKKNNAIKINSRYLPKVN